MLATPYSHLRHGFKLKKSTNEARERFFSQSWSTWTPDSLLLRAKYEFDASNRDFCAKPSLLAEDSL